jgi:hypothetical protein
LLLQRHKTIPRIITATIWSSHGLRMARNAEDATLSEGRRKDLRGWT